MDKLNINVNGCPCISLDDVAKVASADFYQFVAEWLNDEDFVVAHTSGSTGTPKEVKLQKSDMIASAMRTVEFFSLDKESVLYLNLSPNYIAGKMMIVRAIVLNATIYEEAASNAPLSNHNLSVIDLAAFVPSQMQYLLNNEHLLHPIKNIIIGGGAISEKMKNRIGDMGINAYATYGMTETCSHIALARIGRGNEPYKALPGISFSTDDRGCLVADVPHLSIQRVITNDVVVLVDNHSFYWHGRWDNVVNSGGIKIFPKEVEHRIAQFFTGTRFYITSRASEKWGEELVLALEYPSLPEGVVKHGDIIPHFVEKMRMVLPAHSIPRIFVAVRKFDETASGKIKRRKF